MGSRLEHNIAAGDWPFHAAVNFDSFGRDRPPYNCLPRNNEGCALQFPVNLTTNLDEAVGSYGPDDFQTLRDDGPTLSKVEHWPTPVQVRHASPVAGREAVCPSRNQESSEERLQELTSRPEPGVWLDLFILPDGFVSDEPNREFQFGATDS